GVVELSDHGRQDVGSLEVEVIVGAVEVGGHGRDEAGAMLLVVGLAELDARDLGDCVPLVGPLQRTCEKVLFLDWLGALAWVDARRPQEEELRYPESVRGLDDV